MKIIYFFVSIFLSINILAQTTNFIDIKLNDTSKIKISGRTTVIGNTSNISSVNSNGYSTNYDKILFAVESGDPSIAGQSVGGFLTPRMTTTQRNTIFNGTTINGTLIYNTTTNAFEYYSTGSNGWVQLSGSSGSNLWALATNGTDIYNTNSSNIGIGTNTPRAKLEVNGTLYITDDHYQLGGSYFNNSLIINQGNFLINAGTLNIKNGINVASSKFIVDNAGNITNTGNITSNNISCNGSITAKNDILTNFGNINFGGKIISTTGKLNFTEKASVGGLPITHTFTTKGGSLIINYSGTGYVTSSGAIGLKLSLDGNEIASSINYTNTTNSHISISGLQILSTNIAAGSHTLTLDKANSTTYSDNADFYYISAFEVPF